MKTLAENLKDPNSKESHFCSGTVRQFSLNAGPTHRAFHPHGEQQVLMISPEDLFSVTHEP